MTQEELDALMAGGGDFDDIETESPKDSKKDTDKSEYCKGSCNSDIAKGFKLNPTQDWPPAPPTDDYKVVHQLDDVTKDSEVKATQIFEKLEAISQELMDIESFANEIQTVIDDHIELFTLLSEKFPKIETFKSSIQSLQKAVEHIDSIKNLALAGGDEIMIAMDIMQYQDIHRQKIERVINVMRALTKYLNSLFEGKIDDEKRVSSATHLPGDSTEELVDEDDIEALILSFGKKK